MIRDEATRDLIHTRLKLRDDLIVRPERSGTTTWYHVECRDLGRFFRIGLSEYTFISLFDGSTTPATAMGLTARILGADAFTEEQATSILLWLIENDLATRVDAGFNGSTSSHQSDRETREALNRLNPFFLRLPFGNPDRLAEKLTHYFGWLHAWPTVIAALFVGLTALTYVANDWAEFQQSARTVLAPDNWLWLTLTWVGLKVIHESSHGIACKRLGGNVSETGLIFILCAPVAYVDVTSSLRFRSKWQRIQIAAAGMYAELVVAAFALLIWTQVGSELGKHLLHNVVLMASLSTLLFNANPLMKFDGYYMLSDWMEIPNLAARGNDVLRSFARQFLLGQQSAPTTEMPLRRRFIVAYGVAAAVWKVLVTVGLLIAASTFFHGLGLVFVAIVAALWFGQTLWKSFSKTRRLFREQPARFVRAATAVSAVLLATLGLLFLTPWPFERIAPGYVEHRDLTSIRAGSPGFIRHVAIQDGQQVTAGTVLIQLENQELEAELNDVLAALSQSAVRYNTHLKDQKQAAAQSEAANHAALEKRLREKRRQFDSLTIKAPIDGQVMSRQLDWLKNTYAHEGDELLTIGNDSQKDFIVSVAQEDGSQLKPGTAISLRLTGNNTLTSTVRQITPRASHVPPHGAITVMAGGPLPVRQRTDEKPNPTANDLPYEFPEPRVTARLALSPDESATLTAGTTGRATLPGKPYRCLGAGLYFASKHWLEEQTASIQQ